MNYNYLTRLVMQRIDHIFSTVLSCLPPSRLPIFSAHDLRCSGGGEEDYFCRLPDELLSNIVSRLPAKDAARTTVLCSRWRDVWASTPLLLDDAHLLPADDRSLVRAIAGAVAAHEGPIRCLRVTHVPFCDHERALHRLIKDLSTKRLEELVLVNRPWPFDVPLPAELLRCASLRSLHLGVWKLPDATSFPPAFTDLRELGIYFVTVRDFDLHAVLARCPNLESLFVVSCYGFPKSIQLRSPSMRCVVLWVTWLRELDISHAPCLERLVLQPFFEVTRIKIGYAPKLEAIGCFDPRFHQLIVGDTVIEMGTKVKPSSMVPSVRMLGLNVCFGVDTQAKLLPTLLRCFPSMVYLYVKSVTSKSSSADIDEKFWDEQFDCEECANPHLKTVVLEGYRGGSVEVAFLKFVLANAQGLEELWVLMDDDYTEEFSVDSILPPSTSGPGHHGRGPQNVRVLTGPCCSAHLVWQFHFASDMSRGLFDAWSSCEDFI